MQPVGPAQSAGAAAAAFPVEDRVIQISNEYEMFRRLKTVADEATVNEKFYPLVVKALAGRNFYMECGI